MNKVKLCSKSTNGYRNHFSFLYFTLEIFPMQEDLSILISFPPLLCPWHETLRIIATSMMNVSWSLLSGILISFQPFFVPDTKLFEYSHIDDERFLVLFIINDHTISGHLDSITRSVLMLKSHIIFVSWFIPVFVRFKTILATWFPVNHSGDLIRRFLCSVWASFKHSLRICISLVPLVTNPTLFGALLFQDGNTVGLSR